MRTERWSEFGKQAGPLEPPVVCRCQPLSKPGSSSLGSSIPTISLHLTLRSVHWAAADRAGNSLGQGCGCVAVRRSACLPAHPPTSEAPPTRLPPARPPTSGTPPSQPPASGGPSRGSSWLSGYLWLIAVSDHPQDPSLEVLHVGHT